jgi:uncharacterized protein YukE
MSFEQLEAYFSELEPTGPASSAQSTWTAGAAEARQLGEELRQQVATLKEHWSGPAATEYYTAMQAIVDFALGLSDDMANMATGLASMASNAAAIQPQALSIIAAAQPHPWTRAAAIAPLTGLLNQLGGGYLSDSGTYWHEPTKEPQRLPKAGDDADTPDPQADRPDDVHSSPIFGDIGKLAQYAQLASTAYQAFSPEKFPDGSGGDLPVGQLPGDISTEPGPNLPVGTTPGMPSPNDPDYKPLPDKKPEMSESPVQLAGATPMTAAGTPPVSLAVSGGSTMSSPGGTMPMAAMGMGGMGSAGGAIKTPPSRPGGAGGGPGLFGTGGGQRGGRGKDEEGVRTWLTEDELAWDADEAPDGVVG